MDMSKTTWSNLNPRRVVDILIRLSLLYFLVSWCFELIKPFALVLTWGAIIAIAVYPVYAWLVKVLGGRKWIASMVVAMVMMSFIVIPAWLLTESVLNGYDHFKAKYQLGQPLIPPPGETVYQWPTIAQPVVQVWQQASDNLQVVVIQYRSQLTQLGGWLLTALGSFGKSLIQFLISMLLAAVLLFFSSSIQVSVLKIFKRLTPVYGENFATLTTGTVRNVVNGVLGVAIIQATMASIGFFVAGVPYAGIWTIICLMLSIVQIGSWPVILPMIFYVFSNSSPLTAILFMMWMAIVLFIDNVLTPILIGRGSSIPKLALFIGSTGGFITIGFLGLFLGAVIISIMYTLFEAWLNVENQPES